MKMSCSWLEELTSSTEDSSEDDAQPLLLWVPQTVQSSGQETVDHLPKTKSVCGRGGAAPRVPIVLRLCYMAKWANQVGSSID